MLIFLFKLLKKNLFKACGVPENEHITTNTSGPIRHNEFVQLSCNKLFKSDGGERIRKCQFGELDPSLQESPFKCLPRKYFISLVILCFLSSPLQIKLI